MFLSSTVMQGHAIAWTEYATRNSIGRNHFQGNNNPVVFIWYYIWNPNYITQSSNDMDFGFHDQNMFATTRKPSVSFIQDHQRLISCSLYKTHPDHWLIILNFLIRRSSQLIWPSFWALISFCNLVTELIKCSMTWFTSMIPTCHWLQCHLGETNSSTESVLIWIIKNSKCRFKSKAVIFILGITWALCLNVGLLIV